jgi:hypothetical protein
VPSRASYFLLPGVPRCDCREISFDSPSHDASRVIDFLPTADVLRDPGGVGWAIKGKHSACVARLLFGPLQGSRQSPLENRPSEPSEKVKDQY